jgi:glycosyltransferase involved in cell wall biosynthesis
MISDVYFPRINGVSTSIQTFRNEFEKQGHEVYLITPEYPTGQKEDARIFRIPSRGVALDPEDRMMHYRDILRLVPRLRELEFDLLHIHTPFVAHYGGIKLASKLKLPCVITYHTLFEEYLYHYIPFLPKQALRLFARRFSSRQCNQVDGVIAPSTVIVDLLQDYGVKQHIEIIPTGIHCHKFEDGDGAGFRARYGIPSDRKLLLNVSRVAFEKNMGVLLDMLDRVRNQVPEVYMVIAGEGPAKKHYMKQAHDMGLEDHIAFVGYLDRDSELIDCYHSADLFVFSSRTETQGLVLLESMAAGTPVVSIAAMGTRDILFGCDGARITDGSVDDFAAKVITVLKDENSLRELGIRASAYAQKWDSTVLANRMLGFYREVLQVPEESVTA